MNDDSDDVEKLIREYDLDEDKESSTATTYEYREGSSKKVTPVRKIQIESQLKSLLGSRKTIALYEIIDMLNEITTKESIEDKQKNGYTRDDEMQLITEYLERNGITLQSVSLEAENLNDEDIVEPTVAKRTSGVGSLDYRTRDTKRKIPQLSKEIHELAFKIDEMYLEGKKQGKSLEEIAKDAQDLVEQEQELWKERKKLYNKKYKEFSRNLNRKLFNEFQQIKNEKAKVEEELSYMEEGTKEYEETLKRLDEIEDRYIEIRNSLVENNQGLLFFILGKNIRNIEAMLGDVSVEEYPFVDRIQEGYLGLISAVEYYDNFDFEFSNYAVPKIVYSIVRGKSGRLSNIYPINNSRDIHIPRDLMEDYNKIDKARKYLEEVLGREPTYREIYLESGVDPQRAIRAEQAYNLSKTESLDQDTGIIHTEDGQEFSVENATKLPGEGVKEHVIQGKNEDEFRDIRRNPGEVLRQGQAKVNEEVLPEDEDIPFETMLGDNVVEQLVLMLDNLPKRDRELIEERFGLVDGMPKTLEELSREYRVNVRMIQNRILMRLRHPSRSEGLMRFLKGDDDDYTLNFDQLHIEPGEYLRAKQKLEEAKKRREEIKEETKKAKALRKKELRELGCTPKESEIIARMERPSASTRTIKDIAKSMGIDLEEATRLVNSAMAKINEHESKQQRISLEQSITRKIERVRELTAQEDRNQEELHSAIEELNALTSQYLQEFPQEKDKGEIDE